MKIAKRYELVPLEKIVAYARNPRKHSKEQVAQIRASFREFGVLSPCLVDENYNLICGHGRLEAARAEGLAEINCVVAEGLTEAQKKAFIIADNKLTENSTWDDDLLSLEFADLKDLGFDLELTGFDPSEIEKLFADSNSDVVDDDFDLSAALEEAAFAMPGDIWTLSDKHRLMCGDATKTADVERLMGGKKANLVLTDIPYGVNFKSPTTGLSIMNDNLKGEEFYSFLLSSFQNMHDALDNEGSIYVFHADTEGLVTRRAYNDAGFKLSGCCIWVKNTFVMGRAPYHFCHEPVLYGWKKKGTHKWLSDRKQSTIWNFDKPKKNAEHPNQKPLDLMAYPIKNSCPVNGIVLDSFGGSGSTMLACEQIDRICYMMELDPKYASVILRRYALAKENNGADIVCERNGEILRYGDLVKEVANE